MARSIRCRASPGLREKRLKRCGCARGSARYAWAGCSPACNTNWRCLGSFCGSGMRRALLARGLLQLWLFGVGCGGQQGGVIRYLGAVVHCTEGVKRATSTTRHGVDSIEGQEERTCRATDVRTQPR